MVRNSGGDYLGRVLQLVKGKYRGAVRRLLFKNLRCPAPGTVCGMSILTLVVRRGAVASSLWITKMLEWSGPKTVT
jgi:hypothetical protein